MEQEGSKKCPSMQREAEIVGKKYENEVCARCAQDWLREAHRKRMQSAKYFASSQKLNLSCP